MHKALLLSSLLLAATLATAATTQLTQLTGCAAKRQTISEQIEAAKSHGNSSQQAGLEKALKEVENNCNDASLRAEREAKVVEAEDEVSEREGDLREALADGDQDDISKRQHKLEEARAELQQAREELSK
ncbi:MAG TPA: DUF1090 domain-containing protein [Pseudomonas sp.]|nr:DUF1090 domain-containing protein [Pseudomonas sp.]